MLKKLNSSNFVGDWRQTKGPSIYLSLETFKNLNFIAFGIRMLLVNEVHRAKLK